MYISCLRIVVYVTTLIEPLAVFLEELAAFAEVSADLVRPRLVLDAPQRLLHSLRRVRRRLFSRCHSCYKLNVVLSLLSWLVVHNLQPVEIEAVTEAKELIEPL